jgi:hypothetical protein
MCVNVSSSCLRWYLGRTAKLCNFVALVMKFGFTVVEKKVVHFLFLQIFKFYSKIKSNFEFTETLDLSSCEFKSKFQKLFKI